MESSEILNFQQSQETQTSEGFPQGTYIAQISYLKLRLFSIL